MVFSSLEFLCVFLPIVFILYTVIPNLRAKNFLLIIASLLFYAYGEPVYVLLMIGSVIANYGFARLIAARENTKKIALAADIVVNIGVLCIFKYSAFFVETINQIFASHIPVPELALPIGISFFTFQALSYVIDVYRGTVDVQKNFFDVMLYISFFPQLIAGPIVKYKDIYKEIEDRKQDIRGTTEGLWRFAVGLGKKVLIANTVGEVADAVFTAETGEINMAVAWLGAVAYVIQIYFDFSGYSDMAIGLGKMFGFHFKENFDYPYDSKNVKEFWRRWHISLSTWFKEYLYIPLGGNRKGRTRTSINKIIVFLCTGLWHGASWTFVIWGIWHGFFLLLEDYVPAIQKLPKVVCNIYTMLVVGLGFVIFRADTLGQGVFMIGQMFTGTAFTAASMSFLVQQLTPWFIVMLIIGIIGAGPIRPLAARIKAIIYQPATKENFRLRSILQGVLAVASVLLIVWCMLRLSGNTYNPFIYFRF